MVWCHQATIHTWSNVDKFLPCHMALPEVNELTHWSLKYTATGNNRLYSKGLKQNEGNANSQAMAMAAFRTLSPQLSITHPSKVSNTFVQLINQFLHSPILTMCQFTNLYFPRPHIIQIHDFLWQTIIKRTLHTVLSAYKNVYVLYILYYLHTKMSTYFTYCIICIQKCLRTLHTVLSAYKNVYVLYILYYLHTKMSIQQMIIYFYNESVRIKFTKMKQISYCHKFKEVFTSTQCTEYLDI